MNSASEGSTDALHVCVSCDARGGDLKALAVPVSLAMGVSLSVAFIAWLLAVTPLLWMGGVPVLIGCLISAWIVRTSPHLPSITTLELGVHSLKVGGMALPLSAIRSIRDGAGCVRIAVDGKEIEVDIRRNRRAVRAFFDQVQARRTAVGFADRHAIPESLRGLRDPEKELG